MFKSNFVLLLILFYFSMYGQNDENYSPYGKYVEWSITPEATYHIYDPPFKAQPIMTSSFEAKNRYPEELMISLISENNPDWVDLNTADGTREKSTDYFRQKIQWNKDETYYELTSKLTLTIGDTEYAYVRFRFYDKNIENPPSGVYLLKKVDNRWYYSKKVLSNDLTFIITWMKPELLGKLLKGEKNGDAIFDELVDKISSNGRVSIKSLEKEVMAAYYAERTAKEQKFTKYFSEPLNW